MPRWYIWKLPWPEHQRLLWQVRPWLLGRSRAKNPTLLGRLPEWRGLHQRVWCGAIGGSCSSTGHQQPQRKALCHAPASHLFRPLHYLHHPQSQRPPLLLPLHLPLSLHYPQRLPLPLHLHLCLPGLYPLPLPLCSVLPRGPVLQL